MHRIHIIWFVFLASSCSSSAVYDGLGQIKGLARDIQDMYHSTTAAQLTLTSNDYRVTLFENEYSCAGKIIPKQENGSYTIRGEKYISLMIEGQTSAVNKCRAIYTFYPEKGHQYLAEVRLTNKGCDVMLTLSGDKPVEIYKRAYERSLMSNSYCEPDKRFW